MLSEIAVAAVAAVGSQHATTPHHHARGCRTDRCDRIVGRRWWERHHPEAGWPEALASWYDDAEGTACGTHYPLGVANKTLPCGTRVRLCHGGACETVVVEDRGPFIAGRTFDLNPGAKAGIGCSDLCTVRWHLR